MITQETVTIDGRELVHTYSDKFMLQNEAGQEYYEAYDIPGAGHTYTETDTDKDPELTDYKEIAEILLGERG